MKLGRWFAGIAILALLIVWGIGWHLPWMHNHPDELVRPTSGLSVETTFVGPAFIRERLPRDWQGYFERLTVVRNDGTEVEINALQNLHHLESCVLQTQRPEVRHYRLRNCPRLEKAFLIGVLKVTVENCPALRELRIVRNESDLAELFESLPASVSVFVDGDLVRAGAS